MELLDRRFLIVTGKGGVGKTTVSVALALAAAAQGKRVLIAMANTKERVSELLDSRPVGFEIVNVAPRIDAVNMEPMKALEEYGVMILKVRAVYRAVFENRFVRAFLRGTPGLQAWAMLGKAFFHASPHKGRRQYDLVILDAPATGHALDMLRVPMVIQRIAPPGLLRREAERALELFRNEKEAGAVLVTLPEDMPVNETIELRDALVDELKIPVLHLVINRVLERLFDESERPTIAGLYERTPESSPLVSLARAGRRRVLREHVQRQSIAQVTAEIPVDTTQLPYCFGLDSDRDALDGLAEAFMAGGRVAATTEHT